MRSPGQPSAVKTTQGPVGNSVDEMRRLLGCPRGTEPNQGMAFTSSAIRPEMNGARIARRRGSLTPMEIIPAHSSSSFEGG